MCESIAEGGARCSNHACATAQSTQDAYVAAFGDAAPALDPLVAADAASETRTVQEAASAPPENPFTKKYDSVSEKITAIQGELNAAVEGLAKDENWLKYLNTMNQFHTYSWSNQLLIITQRQGASKVAGFNTWKKMGRHVNKGERGIQILAPRIVRDKDAEDSTEKKKVVGFTTVSVFDISQTSGEDLPEPTRTFSDTPSPQFVSALESEIAASGFTLSYEPITNGAFGYTRPSTKQVVVDPRHTPGVQASVLAHELAHIKAGHLERIDEYHRGHEGKRGAMEVEAESIAYVLCRNAGMDQSTRFSSEYVAGWQGSNPDPEQVKESAQKVASVVKGILTSPSFAVEASTEPAE